MPENSLIVISTGWKCEDTMGRCMSSLYDQGVFIIHRFCIDECKSHTCWVGGSKLIDMSHPNRIGKLANFIAMINDVHPKPEDIICDVDLDDYLLPNALTTVLKTYEDNPGILLTHGSYRMESGRPARFNGEYKSDNFRQAKWKASHLKTFRFKLFQKVKDIDLRGPDGKYFMTSSDLALMFPMLEMAGLNRIKHIKECLYCYNDLNPLNDHKVNTIKQKRIELWIRKKPQYKMI